jgi:hypothetical protein
VPCGVAGNEAFVFDVRAVCCGTPVACCGTHVVCCGTHAVCTSQRLPGVSVVVGSQSWACGMRDDMRFAGLHVPCWGLMQELQPQRAVTHMSFTCVDRVLAVVTWRLLTTPMYSAPMHSPRGMWFTSAHSTPPAATSISLLQHLAAISAMVYQQCSNLSAFCVCWDMHWDAQGACVFGSVACMLASCVVRSLGCKQRPDLCRVVCALHASFAACCCLPTMQAAVYACMQLDRVDWAVVQQLDVLTKCQLQHAVRE